MAANKKPRRKYRPRYAKNPVAVFEALNRSHVNSAVLADFHVTLDGDQQRDIGINYGVAIDQVANGKATDRDVGNIGFMCNVAGVLCENGFGEQYAEDVQEAKNALFRAELRRSQGHNWGFDGPGLAAVRRAYDLHVAQIEVAGQGHLVAAGREVTRRAAAGDVMWEIVKN
ncbi:hypothetical protein POK33_38160 [Burkholderia cenocepacia]|uniref:hypothetical protein n=1 Tax=Burkholderia cenocepacia TaxID=95486 RepID=UPI0023B94F83|nr:hypothetical protein [Burkholderia cenocepacia]MDF0506580.1 hypothetical protein [Burkholderia cenocepacia]